MNVYDWVKDLASPSPAPGGGGASALAGALAAALGSMVANLTTGKKKYAAYQQDIERILEETACLTDRLYGLIKKDEEAFLPLSKAYGIPKEDPARGEVLEAALRIAAEPPMEMLAALAELPPILEELLEKGSRLAVSDVDGSLSDDFRLAVVGEEVKIFGVPLGVEVVERGVREPHIGGEASAEPVLIVPSAHGEEVDTVIVFPCLEVKTEFLIVFGENFQNFVGDAHLIDGRIDLFQKLFDRSEIPAVHREEQRIEIGIDHAASSTGHLQAVGVTGKFHAVRSGKTDFALFEDGKKR